MSILDRSESRGGAKVIWLAVHSTEGNDVPRVNDAAALRDASWWTGSSHAICDNEALLTPAEGCVPYERAAWTLRGGNHYSDNIEQVGWARWTRDEWLTHPGTLDNTAQWLAERSKARGIPLTKIGPADVKARRPGVIGHVDYTLGTGDGTHTDPGPNYPWDVVIAKARAYAGGEGSTIVLDKDTANQISGIVVNALTTPLIDWSGTKNSNTSVLQQLKLNAQGLSLILQAVKDSQDPQSIADAIVTILPTVDARKVAELVLAGLNGAQLSVSQPASPA